MTKFLLNMTLYTIASLVLTFLMYPAVLSQISNMNIRVIEKESVDRFSINNFQNLDGVFIVTIATKDTLINKQTNSSSDSYKRLILFFKENYKTTKGIFNESMPFKLDDELLKNLKLSIKISKEKSGEKYISHLELNEFTIFGSEGIWQRNLLYAISYFSLIIGGLCSILIPLSTIMQLKRFYTDGTPLNTPNRFDGLKYIIDSFKIR